jgi:RimJ/RimL family protein N-acetyltransferase
LINPEEIGELVYLRSLEVEDIDEGWLGWVNNPDTSSELTSIGENKKLTKKDLESYLENSQMPKAKMFAICLKADDTYIGNARISSIDYNHSKCSFGRFIGNVGYRGKGLGSEVLKLIQYHCFLRLNLNRVSTVVFTDNIPSIKSNEKAGMVEEGVLRQSIYHKGEFRDVISFAMTRKDFDHIYPNP